MGDMDFDASMVSYIIGQGLYYQLCFLYFYFRRMRRLANTAPVY